MVNFSKEMQRQVKGESTKVDCKTLKLLFWCPQPGIMANLQSQLT